MRPLICVLGAVLFVAGCGGGDDDRTATLAGVRYEVRSAKAGEARAIVPRDHVVVRLDVSNRAGDVRAIDPRQFTLRAGGGPPVRATDPGVASFGSAFKMLASGDEAKVALLFITGRPVTGDADLVIRADDDSAATTTIAIDVEKPSAKQQPIGG